MSVDETMVIRAAAFQKKQLSSGYGVIKEFWDRREFRAQYSHPHKWSSGGSMEFQGQYTYPPKSVDTQIFCIYKNPMSNNRAPDEAPELTDVWFESADLKIGNKLVRRGRPRGSAKQQVAIRLDSEIIEHFKSGGAGWQSRINAALKDWVSTH